ncbi:MAG: thioredoxin fold domain-containing protein [Candidatus Latescibacteria bacterium]|nr:thioredoxin fold domain-containing protein [Candidatus Latescibacterota bacterium]
MKKNLSSIIIILLLAVIIIIVIISKSSRTKSAVPARQITDTLSLDSSALTPIPVESLSPPIKSQQAKLDKNTIAMINDFKVTTKYFDERLQSLPEPYKSQYKNDKEGFLEQLIIRELLYQEAEHKGFSNNLSHISDAQQRKDEAINRYINDITQKIMITEQEIQQFYNANITQMQGMKLEQVKNDIRNYLAQQKQGEFIPQLIDRLITNADVTKNEQWLREQRASRPPNPLDVTLKNGKPTVLDLGSETCVPCKMMKPIFAELETEYKDRANIIILDIYEHRDLSSKYRVRVIPTQIFFDKDGNQTSRHEGFMSKQDIINRLKELGVE